MLEPLERCRSLFRSCSGAVAAAVFGVLPATAGAGFVSSSLERYSYQTGDAALTIRSYDAFDEISGPDQFPGVTGLTVQVNGGPEESIAFDPFYNAYKRRQSWGSVAEMVATRPVDATIVQRLRGLPAGAVSILAPGVVFADAVPVSPMFEVTGVDGYWSYDTQGRGIFTFAAADVAAFTVRLNGYAVSTAGSQFFYLLSVADVGGAFSLVDQQHSGLLAAGAAAPAFSATFTRGLPPDGGDADPTTFGFDVGSFLLLEGEFGNVFGLADAGLGDGSLKAFVYQSNSSLLLQAVPEASTSALFAIGALLVGYAVRRRTSTPTESFQ